MTKKRQILFSVIRGLLAILIALLVATLLIFLSADGDSFAEKLAATGGALKQLLVGPLFRMGRSGTKFDFKRLTDILASMIPIIFTGLSVCVMFSANQFNLGAEGGIMLGAFSTAMVAVYVPMAAAIHPIVGVSGRGGDDAAAGAAQDQARRERDGLLADAQLHRHVLHQVPDEYIPGRQDQGPDPVV